jgi:hypothetical protein
VFFLVFEEPDFSFHPTPISHEFATRTDDSMTRDDDDDTIVMIGSADSPDSTIMRDHLRLFPIAASLAVWDSLQSLPGVFLKICSIDSERDIEVFSLSLKVFSEFLFCLL